MLRPCKVITPRQLPAGEYEFWMRFVDAAVWTLESNLVGGSAQDFPQRTARSVEVVGSGAPVDPMPRVEDTGLVATAFSGGRDSLTQLGLLQELGETPLLVTVTSTREGSEEFKTARRRAVIEEIPERRDVELVEVNTDLRGCWNIGDERAARYGIGVSEISDTMLYFAVAWATAFARGCSDVFLASESEVQETVVRDGMILQHKHFMYSAITQTALRALVFPTGIGHSGLTYPLRQFQVQRLLGTRYPDVRDLQYSCWSQRPGEDVCSRCRECFGIAVNLMADDIAPAEIGMDLDRLLPAQRAWQAGGDPRFPRDAVGALASFQNDNHVVRYFHAHGSDHLEQFFTDKSPRPDTTAAFEEIRANALLVKDPVEEPGYRTAYVDLMPERLRPGMHAILSEHFYAEPIADHSSVFERTRTLGNWIAAPLSAAAPTPQPGAHVRSELPRIAPASEPSTSQLLEIANEIPGAEPTMASPNGKRALPVADTDLTGNELAYVTEAIESNWVSSAGPYVDRLEADFAEYCGTRYAVTTASGATALEVMLRAGGVEPGDEVILPTFTMVATANAVHSLGAKVVFVDSDLATWNMDLKRVVEAIGPKTRAIVA
ncbi:MAG: aminotransferase class I/II-fold pyridoxal phosphate-dependent enzyme, partial [Solirubrobacterales bacterium]